MIWSPLGESSTIAEDFAVEEEEESDLGMEEVLWLLATVSSTEAPRRSFSFSPSFAAVAAEAAIVGLNCGGGNWGEEWRRGLLEVTGRGLGKETTGVSWVEICGFCEGFTKKEGKEGGGCFSVVTEEGSSVEASGILSEEIRWMEEGQRDFN